MTLKEIRKMLGVSREQVAMMNGCTQMVIRRIENKHLIELTFSDLECYVCAMNVTIDDLIGMLLGIDISATDLKGAFWEFNFNRTINVKKTYLSLINCSNMCTITTLQSYSHAKNKFDNIKLNWCYYKLTGKELNNEN